MLNLNSSNSSPIAHAPTEMLAGSVVLGFCFVLGVPGNIAAMVRLSGWLKGDNFTPRLMLSLAVSDFLTLLPLPVWIWTYLNGWFLGLFLCKVCSYIMYTGLYCSILCVILLSVQRYVQVLHPQKWAKLGGRERKLLVGVMWMLSGVFASYSLVQFTVSGLKNEWIRCKPSYRNDTERVATLFWETLMFIVPFPILAYFYFRLYQGVNRSTFFKSHKLTVLLTRILVTFFVFWIPYVVNNFVRIAALLLRIDKLLTVSEACDYVTAALPFINSCVNPFLYVFSARALQQQPAGPENT